MWLRPIQTFLEDIPMLTQNRVPLVVLDQFTSAESVNLAERYSGATRLRGIREADRRDGELKMCWTKPRLEWSAYGY